MGVPLRSKQRVDIQIVLCLSFRVSNVTFVQFCSIEYIGTKQLNSSTWTLKLTVMAVRLLAVEVVILSSHYLSLLKLIVPLLFEPAY